MTHIALSLRDIYFNKRSGRLVYRRGDTEKYFFFQKGTLIQVKTNVPEERLGEVLYKLERISKDAHATMDEFVEPNQNIGEVLRSRGVISEQDLSDALTYQMRETTLNVFPHFDAEISFQEREDFTAGSEESKISIPFIIEYGIRRMQPNPSLKAFLARQVPFLKRKSFAYLLTPDEKEILDRISGQDSAESILRTLTSPPDFFWKSLYLFYCLDLVDLKPAEEPREARAATGPAPKTEAGGVPPDVAEVLAFRETLAQKNFYQLLEVGRTASDDDIKKAYFQMARRFHPDRFDRKASAEYKSQIDEVFDAITNAYRVLSNKDKRAAYDSGAQTGAQEEAQDTVKMAEIKFRQGKTLFGMDRFDDAVALLEEAVRLRRDKADYHLLLAMAESRIPSYVRKAETDFLKAINLEPWNPEGYVGLGVLYRTEGLQTKAIRQFEKALEADPEHAKARQELSDMGVGIKKKKGLQSLLSSLDFLSGKGKKKK
ncbi:MAG TPA: DnaJ domain-containing protein [Burkholderiales bacterium]|nr:DnaJ domain-containing protein [Burkholderiales bacterium]